MNIIITKIEPVDVLVVPKNLGIIEHYAVYLGFDQYGNEWVTENTPFDGTKMTPANVFFSRNPNILRIQKFRGTENERRVAVQRALKNLNRPYRLMNYNCEHYANQVQSDISHSSQVRKAAGLALGVAILGTIIGLSQKNKKRRY